MKCLVDSDVVADYMKGREQAVALLTPLVHDGLSISIISYAELYEGIFYGTDRPRYERAFREFLGGVDVLPITRSIAKRYAIIRGHLRTTGQIIDQPDLFIAATALHHDLTLLTRNVRHFDRIDGLRLG